MKIKPIFYYTFLSICFSAALFGQESQRSAETRESLIERENSLIAQMSDLDPGSPDYKAELQKLGTELRGIQERLGTVHLQNRVPDSSVPGEESFLVPSAVSPAAVPPLSSDTADQEEFSPLDGMDSATLLQLRTQIIYQLKYLNETLNTLSPQNPQDEALRSSIGEEQDNLQKRLKEINKKLGTESLPSEAEEEPALPLVNEQNEPADPSRAADFPALTSPAPNIPAVDPTETEGTWYGTDNKSAKILSEITELKKANAETQQQLAEILDELKTIETQLKLLSRQAVADK